jgi:hypothetical protein
MLPPAQQIYQEAPATYQFQFTASSGNATAEVLQTMNDGELDLAVVPRVTDRIGASYPRVRFVGNLLNSALILMSPNEYNIQDLSDLSRVQSGLILANSPFTVTVVQDILSSYPNYMVKNIRVSVNAANEKPLMYAFLAVHPSAEIANLVKEKPMHVVTMSKINNGNYFISQKEKPFYRKHLHYEKASFDMHRDGVKYYPGLSIRGQLLYYPTIKYKYSLYARAEFSDQAVQRLLQELLDKRKTTLALTEVAYNPDESLATHAGARTVYFSKQIYTTEPRPPIWDGF